MPAPFSDATAASDVGDDEWRSSPDHQLHPNHSELGNGICVHCILSLSRSTLSFRAPSVRDGGDSPRCGIVATAAACPPGSRFALPLVVAGRRLLLLETSQRRAFHIAHNSCAQTPLPRYPLRRRLFFVRSLWFFRVVQCRSSLLCRPLPDVFARVRGNNSSSTTPARPHR